MTFTAFFLFEYASEKLLFGHISGNFQFQCHRKFHDTCWSDFDNFVNQNFAYGPHSNSSTSPSQRHLSLNKKIRNFSFWLSQQSFQEHFFLKTPYLIRGWVILKTKSLANEIWMISESMSFRSSHCFFKQNLQFGSFRNLSVTWAKTTH